MLHTNLNPGAARQWYCPPSRNRTYQWLKNGTSLPGQTSSSLSLTSIRRTDAAAYSVIVSNTTATVTNVFQLHVVEPQFLTASFAPSSNILSVSLGDADGGIPTAQDIPTFIIQTSTNLIYWTPVDPGSVPITTNVNGGLSFQVSTLTKYPTAFFRILSK
jgi:hypothetical protein